MNHSKVSLIQGPGQHSSILLEGLKKTVARTDSFGYWPTFNTAAFQNEQPIHQHQLKSLDLVSKWIWRLHHRFPALFKRPWHLDVYYAQYEKWVKKNIDFDQTSLLWAWPQVSLSIMQAFKKRGEAKILLEYPMIHPKTWNETILSESEKWNRNALSYYSLFSERMVHKMEEEIDLADKIIVLSEFARQSFIRRKLPTEKLVKIELPVALSRKKEKSYQRKGKLVFLYVGRVELSKGVQYLITAFNKVGALDAQLWLAGTVLPEMKDFIARTTNKNIKVLGFQNKEELDQLYAQADVMVFPTLQDSFGMVILEAMSHGLPVIASAHSGAPDIIEHGKNGFIYDPFKVKDFEALLLHFIENRQLVEELGRNAQLVVTKLFTKQQYFEKLGAIIKTLT